MVRHEGQVTTVGRALVASLLLVCVVFAARAQEQAAYRNPVIAGDYPDPSVIRVGVEFWAATTTGGWAPHFALLRSRDLVNWEKVGYVFQSKPAWAKSSGPRQRRAGGLRTSRSCARVT